MGVKRKEGEIYQEKRPELRIQGVSLHTRKQVFNISKHLGQDMSAFMRSKLEEIINSFPEFMKKPPIGGWKKDKRRKSF